MGEIVGEGGCCFGAVVDSFPEDALYGDGAVEMWGESGLPVVGTFYAECSEAADIELYAGAASPYDVMSIWMANATPEDLEAMEIFPEDTVDSVIELQGGDVFSFQETVMTMGCAADVDAAEE